MNCPLCNQNNSYFYEDKFYICKNCYGIYKNKIYYLTSNLEKKRYLEHNNDVNDSRYQHFVNPIVLHILNNYAPNSTGLDFGCGTGPVISKMLKDKFYNIKMYDPFFADDKKLLNNQYDYIVSCEVIEHFKNVYFEFEQLYKRLKPNGELICMTHLYDPSINFSKWYYKRDTTHLFIYQKKTIAYIANLFNFKSYSIKDRLIVFKKGLAVE